MYHLFPRFVTALGAAALGLPLAAADDAIDFGDDIRPILSDKCFFCHGPDEHERKGGLRLDTYEGATAEDDGVRAVVPGNPEKSELLVRITSGDPDEVMPPADSHKSLTREEIDLLTRWVREGAPWEEHWAFVPPVAQDLPDVSLPLWTRNSVDYFILARLDREGLEPSEEAERSTLARRVALDLTGLPPKPAEVREFLADARPGAYERLVDRLITSPRYGEHMARYWLDAARYADTHGLHFDNYREIWPYRDWVVRAFNQNKPFDEFIVEQLAGDLLPEPTRDQLIATGFNRCHVTTNEGGSIKEEIYVRNVKDRVDTFGTVFLGMTLGCASCHDHKYDPLTQKEYYQLFAYFNNLDANPMDGNARAHAPVIRTPDATQEKELQDYQVRLADVKDKIQKTVREYVYTEPEVPSPPVCLEPEEIIWVDDTVPEGAVKKGVWKPVSGGGYPVISGKTSFVQEGKGTMQHFFNSPKKPLAVGGDDVFFTYVFLDPENPPAELMLQFYSNGWRYRVFWGEDRIDWGKKGTAARLPVGDLPEPGRWVRLEVKASSLGINKSNKIAGWAFTQYGGKVYWDKAGILKSPGQLLRYDSLDEWVKVQRQAEKPDAPEPVLALIRKEPATLGAAERQEIRDFFIEEVYTGLREVFTPLHTRLDDLNNKIAEAKKSHPTTLVWKERPEIKEAFILDRGEYDIKKEGVVRAVPAVFTVSHGGGGQPGDRLALARWLTTPGHPLTARVMVNRFWQQLFGTGLVKTSEDFGLQGEPPSHPELLDWLANYFVRSGWDTRGLMRLLVTSATYRQSAASTPEALRRDGENRLFSRGPRFRLDAEVVRDNALAISGLLVEKSGGQAVKPPQPAGLWEVVGYTGANTSKFEPDTGVEKVHRRSLYTFWKRTSPPPQMSILDAPSRESCAVRRERTNTPLQALLLMNDPQYYEAARALGEKAMEEGGSSVRERISYLFERAVARRPSAGELSVVGAAYADHLAHFRADPKAAAAAVVVGVFGKGAAGGQPVPELAAWTLVANLILNLDEVVTKG